MWLHILLVPRPVRNMQVQPDMGIGKKDFFDLQVPFFIPVWRRVAVVTISLCWALFEFATGSPFWGVVFGAMGVVAAWQLLFSGWPDSGQHE